MAAFTSKATGNWGASGQTTWNETGVPGSGDTVTIGAHTVTVDSAITIGADDTGVAVLLEGTSGYNAELVIASGGVLTCLGHLVVSNHGHLHITGTGELKANSTSQYYILGRAYPDGVVDLQKITLAGTDLNNRAKITYTSGGGKLPFGIYFGAFMIDDSGSRLIFTTTYAHIEVNNINAVYGRTWNTTNTYISGLTGTNYLGVLGAGDLNISYTQMMGTGYIQLGQNAYTSGLRNLDHSVFQQEVQTTTDNLSITRCAFLEGLEDSAVSGCAVFNDYNFIHTTRAEATAACKIPAPANAVVQDLVFFHNNPSNGNCAWFNLSQYGRAGSATTFNRVILLGDVAGDQGDCFHTPTLSEGGYKINFRNCITLPNLDGDQPGNSIQTSQCIAGAGSVEHCTFFTHYAAIIANESTTTEPLTITSCKSNLVWRRENGAGAIFTRFVNPGNAEMDILDPAETGYNGLVNCNALPTPASPDEITYAYAYTGFEAATNDLFSEAPLGVGTDVVKTGVTPSALFTDPDVHVTTYAVARGLASSGDSNATKKTAFLAAMAAQYNTSDADYDATVNSEDFQLFLMAGMVPIDIDFQAAHDSENGGWIGAMEGSVPTESLRRKMVYTAEMSSILHKPKTYSTAEVLMGRTLIATTPHGLRRMFVYMSGFVRKSGRFNRKNPTRVTLKHAEGAQGIPAIPPTFTEDSRKFWWNRRKHR